MNMHVNILFEKKFLFHVWGSVSADLIESIFDIHRRFRYFGGSVSNFEHSICYSVVDDDGGDFFRLDH